MEQSSENENTYNLFMNEEWNEGETWIVAKPEENAIVQT
jgi:hypothetical protein